MNDNELDLGCQGYMALQYHMEEALIEKGLNPADASFKPPIAIFSRQYYNDINGLNHEKKHDFCFIGSINSCYERRSWIVPFVKSFFTENSVFINTDNDKNWQSLGSFDYTKMNLGYCPKNNTDNQSKKVQYRVVSENLFYFEKMCQSKFVLCPGGDAPWSFRFYEVLMCKSLPIVQNWHHTYRTKEESNLKYKYLLSTEIHKDIPYDEYINENTKIFEQYHLLN